MKQRRLIDADELLGKIADKIRELPTPTELYDDGVISGLDIAFGMIETAPTVGAVEEVLCQDCKKKLEEHGYLWCYKWNAQVLPDNFCSYGERKTDNGEE